MRKEALWIPVCLGILAIALLGGCRSRVPEIMRANRNGSDATRAEMNGASPGDPGWAARSSFDHQAGNELALQDLGVDGPTGEPMAPAERAVYRLQANDPVVVHLRGIPESANYEYVIDDSGYINLPYIPPIRAEGLTASELQRTIQRTYIDERIYRQITVNVILPTQSFFVRGEVRQPGRFPLTSGMTVLKAIASAGGYTQFANPRRVEIIRAGETITANARQLEQDPELDFNVKAGDVIIVRRSIF